jgi:hypothetical protein
MSAGYAAVWATENTRAAIWDADDAQGGLRHLRHAHDACASSVAGITRAGDAEVAPRGRGRLRQGRAHGGRPLRARRLPARRPPSWWRRPEGLRWAPTWTASRSSKAWVDASGQAQEKIYDVAWSGNRRPGAKGQLPPVGDTVDVANATWTNTIGAPELAHGVARPRLQALAAGPVLRARDRDPHTALDGLRPAALRHQDAQGGAR